MEQRASYLLVGIFVLALLAGLFGFTVWLARSAFEEPVDRYRIYFTGNVTGLREGSPVLYRGVPVGTVTEIRIDPANVERVQVTVEVPETVPIKADAVATLELQVVTGVALVQILGGTQDAPILEEGEDGVAVIPSRAPVLTEAVEAAPELLSNLILLTERIQGVLAPENQQAIAETLENLRQLTGALAVATTAATGTLEEVEGAAAEARALVTTVNRSAATLTEEAEATLAATRQTIESVGGQAGEAVARLQSAAGRLDTILQENQGPLQDFTSTGLYELSQLLAEMRGLTSELSRLTVRIERNPTDFLLGGSRRGVEVR